MNKYLLLRNNKQSGPHSYNELMEIGIKSYDLLWIEGKSASWRYPAEFDEFKTHLEVIKELPIDRSFTVSAWNSQVVNLAPGTYTYRVSGVGLVTESGTKYFATGDNIEWTWGVEP